MRLIPASLHKVPSHREKPDGLTVEFALGKSDALLTRAQTLIPFDSPDALADWVKNAVDSGEVSSVILKVDDEEVGTMTFAIVDSRIGRELVIFTACIESKKLPYLPLLNTYSQVIAKKNRCNYVRFHTVRKGLVKQSIALGFNVSEIVMRKKVSL